MSPADYFILFAGMGLVTYLPRALPLIYLSHKKMPQWLVDWLEYVPVAVLAALLAPILFIDASATVTLTRREFVVAVPTLIFAVKTRSLGGTVLVGMLLYWLAGIISQP